MKIWEKIEIVVFDDDKKGVYSTRIEDFIGGGIVVSTPVFQEGNVRLRDNNLVVVMVTKKDAVYQFSSRIRKLNSPGKDLYMMSPPANIKRIQRRQFVRIDYMSDDELVIINDAYDPDEMNWVKYRSINISGGGMLFAAKEKINNDDLLLINNPIIKELELPSPLLAICRRSILKEKLYLCGIELIRSENLEVFITEEKIKTLPESIKTFDHAAQEKMVSYIFKKQVEFRQKGML